VHGISTAGYTKWYVGSSLLASIITCVPGAAARVWGHDTLIKACWIVPEDAGKRIAWSVGTTYAWTIVSAAVAMASTLSVLFRLFLSKQRVRNAFSGAGLASHALTKQSVLRAVTLRILPHPLFLSKRARAIDRLA
jgi:hypothetical protein